MIIKLPINNTRDIQVALTILRPDVFNIDYASLEARDFYYSLTPQQIEEIREDMAHYEKEHKEQ